MKNIFVLALAIALTACGETPKGNDTNTATNSATASSPATTAPADNHADMVTVDAKKLFADYKENEVKADGLYKGKMLMVTGTVAEIQSGISDEAMLMLKTGSEFEYVTAMIDNADKPKAAETKKGAKVTLHCTSDGEMMGSPMLKDCKFA